jgi:hypothetical protein
MQKRDWQNVAKGAVGVIILSVLPYTGGIIAKAAEAVRGIINRGSK